MKILKLIFFLKILLMTSIAVAEPDFSKIFTGVEPCFILYDLNHNKTIEQYNSKKCEERVSPCSTFKIPLSLIGYDSGILKNEDSPKWKFDANNKEHMKLDVWKQDHTPKTWMTNSVVWYSQVLTQKLGMKKFQEYVAKFNYGNQDLSGEPGKSDGLTKSWLGSSLKISPNEQIQFLKKLLANELQVSKNAIKYTKNILFIEELAHGWKLYGKTGSGSVKNADGGIQENIHNGWFVGFLEKQDQIYIFAVNIRDLHKTNITGSLRAKEMAKKIFANLDILK